MSDLYPLKFIPIYKDKIWGGNKIRTILGKDFAPLPNCGEYWAISGVEGEQSVVESGFLEENELNDLIEVYMGDLVGDKVFEKFGIVFPLLIKFINSEDDLSIQVHPDDVSAKKNHGENFGKTEMWYVLDAEENSDLIAGLKKQTNKEEFANLITGPPTADKVLDVLNVEKVKKGDVFFIPAGRVHGIGKGILLAEIQQTSDITYRIYDYDRIDATGLKRELHIDNALSAIDFTLHDNYKTEIAPEINKEVELVNCDYFTTNFYNLNKPISFDNDWLDSFVIHICVEGKYSLKYEDNIIEVKKGEAILIPAVIKQYTIIPYNTAEVIEVYIQ